MPRTHEKRLTILKEAIQPVTGEDRMAEAGRKILLANTIDMFNHERQLEGDESVHHVHQMRVATRRLRSAFRILEVYYAPKAVRPFVGSIRTTARRLGDVRDLDVLTENLTTYQLTLDETRRAVFQPLLDQLQERRTKARAVLFEWLDGSDYKRFIRGFTTFLVTEDAGSLKPAALFEPHQVRHVVPVLFHQHLATVRAFDAVLPTDKPEVLHQLRIEFKRLRYVLSFFKDVLGTSIEDYIEEVKAMQEHLGRLNDAVVAQQHLPDEDELDSDQAQVIAEYRVLLEAEVETLLTNFPDLWTHFNTRTIQRKFSDALLVMR